MKYADMISLKYNGRLTMDEASLLASNLGAGDTQEASFPVTAHIVEGKSIELKLSSGGSGIWVPYLARRNLYGFMDGAASWAASGPYSGCYFEVGTSKGRTYVAHISGKARATRTSHRGIGTPIWPARPSSSRSASGWPPTCPPA